MNYLTFPVFSFLICTMGGTWPCLKDACKNTAEIPRSSGLGLVSPQWWLLLLSLFLRTLCTACRLQQAFLNFTSTVTEWERSVIWILVLAHSTLAAVNLGESLNLLWSFSFLLWIQGDSYRCIVHKSQVSSSVITGRNTEALRVAFLLSKVGV